MCPTTIFGLEPEGLLCIYQGKIILIFLPSWGNLLANLRNLI